MNLCRFFGKLWLYFNGGIRRFIQLMIRPLFSQCGENVRFNPFDNFTFDKISIGNKVYIGPGANFSASNTFLNIGNNVIFGPNVTIMAGDHNTGVIGQFMFDVKEKRPEDDQPVQIEDDVWIAANVTILKGVRIGRGAIVAAGSVVTNNAPPYSVVGGVPARLIKFRWTIDQILEHEKAIYPSRDRLSRQILEAIIIENGKLHAGPHLYSESS